MSGLIADCNININSKVYKVDINSRYLNNVHVYSIAFRRLTVNAI